jgi:hypothetical protein
MKVVFFRCIPSFTSLNMRLLDLEQLDNGIFGLLCCIASSILALEGEERCTLHVGVQVKEDLAQLDSGIFCLLCCVASHILALECEVRDMLLVGVNTKEVERFPSYFIKTNKNQVLQSS